MQLPIARPDAPRPRLGCVDSPHYREIEWPGGQPAEPPPAPPVAQVPPPTDEAPVMEPTPKRHGVRRRRSPYMGGVGQDDLYY